MAKKKQLTIKQQKNKLRTIQYSTFVAQFGSVVAPYGVLAAINWDKWFISNPEGWKVGVGGSIALVVVGVATFLVARGKENKELTDGYVSLILGWLLMAFALKLIGQVILEISDIMFIGATGLIGAFGLNLESKHAKKQADGKKKAMESAIEERDKEAYKEELRKEEERKQRF